VRPILIEFGGIAIPSYGVMLVISFIVAILYVRKATKKFDISPIIIENLAFYLMVGVIVGGRILYVIFHWHQYENDLLGIIRIWEGGMMFFGGFIGAMIAGFIYLRKQKISVLKVADIIAPAIALGTFFTRIGCFLNGCCFGTPSTLPWAIKFPPHCVAGSSPIGQYSLHPTQIFSSLFGLALFFFLNRKLKRIHRTGEVFAFYLMFSGIFRFGVDFIRYYENPANFWINQVIAIAVAGVGVFLYSKILQKKP
jgi:phosphatidylglycerol:prolipoprotein diacylglycerol transferase